MIKQIEMFDNNFTDGKFIIGCDKIYGATYHYLSIDVQDCDKFVVEKGKPKITRADGMTKKAYDILIKELKENDGKYKWLLGYYKGNRSVEDVIEEVLEEKILVVHTTNGYIVFINENRQYDYYYLTLDVREITHVYNLSLDYDNLDEYGEV
jgi:hypothetical protein